MIFATTTDQAVMVGTSLERIADCGAQKNVAPHPANKFDSFGGVSIRRGLTIHDVIAIGPLHSISELHGSVGANRAAPEDRFS